MNQLFNFRVVFIVVLFASLLWSCGKEEEPCAVQPDTSGIKLETQIVPFQDSLLHIPSKQKLVAFLTRHPLIRDEIFRRAEYKDDSSFVNELYFKLNNPHFDTLASETRKVFGNLEGLTSEFEQAFTNIKFLV